MRHVAALVLAVLTLLAAPAAARAGDGTDLLRLVPAGAELVGVLDVADARDSAMFAAAMLAALDRAAEVATGLAALGIDAEQDLDTVLVAAHEDGAMRLDVLVLEGRFAASAFAARKGVTTRKHRGVTYLVDGELEIALVKQRVLITTSGGMPAVLELATAKKGKKPRGSVAGAPAAAALRAVIAATDTRNDLWIAALAPELVAAGSRSQGFEVTSLSIAATAATALALQVKVRFADAAAATKLDDLLAAALPQVAGAAAGIGLGGTADSLTVARDGDVIELGAAIPEPELSTVLFLLRSI